MKRFAFAAALALLIGSQAHAQVYYSNPSYYYPGGVVTSGYYTPSYSYGTGYYNYPSYSNVITSSYYAPAYTYGGGYYSPAYTYGSYYSSPYSAYNHYIPGYSYTRAWRRW
jgi:hypothetical protein